MAEPTFAIGELVKLVLALGVTIGLFYALALFMKRMQVGTGKSGGMITVLAALPLGAKEKIWVVDVAGEKLVVGTSPGRVSCLHVLKAVSAADIATGLPGATPSSFLSEATPSSFLSEGTPASFLPEATPSSFLPEATPASFLSEATPASFPRKRESSPESVSPAGLDSRVRGNDAEVASQTLASGFSELLLKFRGGNKP